MKTKKLPLLVFILCNLPFFGQAQCNLSLSISATNSACGLPTGTASVVVTGGANPLTYQWTNGDKTALADSLSAGLYMVLVKDANGCTDTKAAMISDAGSPTITVTSVANVSCNGGNDGGINALAIGGTTPHTYLWMNGATTKNISNLVAGPYEVEVTGGNGCKATKSIVVAEPAKLMLTDTIKNANCGSPDGAAGVIVSGGISPYSYAWNTGGTTQIISNIAAGSYSVTVTDKNGCVKSGMGVVVNVGAATAVLDSVKPGGCGLGKGSIYISVTGGTQPYTYAWSNGATTQDITGLAPGFYGVTIYSNGNPCTGAFSTNLQASKPTGPAICLVTVDTFSGKNICAFKKDSIANLGFFKYNFYRETTTAGVFQLLGSKPANQLSMWTDQSANALQRAWRYKITAVDTCGNEAVISGHHKTVHLAANIGVSGDVNLSWDHYEGFTFGYYVIWRHTDATGWVPYDTMPSNLNSYTDQFPPAPLQNLFYYLEVKNPNGCYVSSIDPGQDASNLNASKSNVNRINPVGTTGVGMHDVFSDVKVFPNPSGGAFTVASSRQIFKNAEVYNVFGEIVFQTAMNGKTETISMNVPNGIYFLKLTGEAGAVTRKIVVQK